MSYSTGGSEKAGGQPPPSYTSTFPQQQPQQQYPAPQQQPQQQQYAPQQQYYAQQAQYPYPQQQTWYPNQPAAPSTIVVQQPPVMVANTQAADLSRPYDEPQQQSTKILGVILMVCGAVCFVSQAVVLGWSKASCGTVYFIFEVDLVPNDGAGIWIGALVFANGLVSYMAGVKNNHCLLNANLALGILSAIFYWVLMGLSAANLSAVNRYPEACENYKVGIVFNAFIQIAAFIHFVCSIWTSSVACCATCCRSTTPAFVVPTSGVVIQTHSTAQVAPPYPSANVYSGVQNSAYGVQVQH